MNAEPILLQNYDKWINYQYLLEPNLLKNVANQLFSLIYQPAEIITVEFTIVLESDLAIRKLNKNFRFIDKPTNVLSFPLHEINITDGLAKHLVDNYIYLGDVVFAYETIEKEAIVQNKLFFNHLIHLLVHSLLHLVGYDHQTTEEADVMENIEIKILQKFNIDSPY